jgi:hypothetical protein
MRSILDSSRLSFSFLFPLSLLAGNDPAAVPPMPWKHLRADIVMAGTHH